MSLLQLFQPLNEITSLLIRRTCSWFSIGGHSNQVSLHMQLGQTLLMINVPHYNWADAAIAKCFHLLVVMKVTQSAVVNHNKNMDQLRGVLNQLVAVLLEVLQRLQDECFLSLASNTNSKNGFYMNEILYIYTDNVLIIMLQKLLQILLGQLI